MLYVLEHSKIGFCWWDLVALLVVIVVIALYVVQKKKLNDRQSDLEDQLSELYDGDSARTGDMAGSVKS